MKSMKLVDKIGIPIFFIGIFGLFYFIRDKSVDWIHFFESLICFASFMALTVYACIKTELPPRLWSMGLTFSGLFIWFEYITTGKIKWLVGIIFLVFSFGINFILLRGEAKPSDSDETNPTN